MKEPDLEEERLIASAQGTEADARTPLDGRQGRAGEGLGPGGETSDVTLQPVRAVSRASGARRSMSSSPASTKPKRLAHPATLTAVANAGIEDPREMSEVTATEQKMKPIADATGGGVFWTKSKGSSVTGDRRRRSAHLDDVVCEGHGRFRLARAQRSSGVSDARRQVDADVYRVRRAFGTFGAALHWHGGAKDVRGYAGGIMAAIPQATVPSASSVTTSTERPLHADCCMRLRHALCRAARIATDCRGANSRAFADAD